MIYTAKLIPDVWHSIFSHILFQNTWTVQLYNWDCYIIQELKVSVLTLKGFCTDGVQCINTSITLYQHIMSRGTLLLHTYMILFDRVARKGTLQEEGTKAFFHYKFSFVFTTLHIFPTALQLTRKCHLPLSFISWNKLWGA